MVARFCGILRELIHHTVITILVMIPRQFRIGWILIHQAIKAILVWVTRLCVVVREEVIDILHPIVVIVRVGVISQLITVKIAIFGSIVWVFIKQIWNAITIIVYVAVVVGIIIKLRLLIGQIFCRRIFDALLNVLVDLFRSMRLFWLASGSSIVV